MVGQLILEQLKDIRADINTLSDKLDAGVKDGVILRAELHALIERVAVVEKIVHEKKPESLWQKVPEKILSWAIPVFMAAILWAFINGYGK